MDHVEIEMPSGAEGLAQFIANHPGGEGVGAARAAEIEWIPAFMRRRLEDWIDGLKWDWNITRQRHYGVPFPVWFCSSCGTPVLARLAALRPCRDPHPAARLAEGWCEAGGLSTGNRTELYVACADAESAERAAVVDHGVRAFCLTSGNLRAHEMADLYLSVLDRIVAACAQPGPFLHAVSRQALRQLDLT